MTPPRPSRQAKPETEVAARIVGWLKDPSHTGGAWEVYQEVEAPGGRCDIVAHRAGTLWTIEVKVGMSLALVEQAVHWLSYAHLSSAAAMFRRSRAAYEHRELLSRLGVGLLAVSSDSYGGSGVYEPVKPKPQTADFAAQLLSRLNPHQKSNVAGGQGGFWTPFRESSEAVLRYVIDHPGCKIADVVVDLGKLHYSSVSSAKSSLLKRIEQRAIKGVWLHYATGTLWHAPIDGKPDLSKWRAL